MVLSVYADLPTLDSGLEATAGAGRACLVGGHLVSFPGQHLYTQTFPMRHYHFLSVPHAIRKYALKHYDLAEVQKGWHDWRPTLRPHMIKLPSQAEMNTYVSDDQLDVSNPRTGHCFFDESLAEKSDRDDDCGR